jgi:hypothetical protein
MSDQLPDVLFLDDLSRLLRCSRRTLEQARADRRPLPPEMPSLDKRPRWLRSTVEEWMRQTQAGQRFKVAHGAGGRR